MVTVTLNGKGEMRAIKIDPSLVDPAEVEILEDLVVAAFNDAKAKVEAHVAGRDGQAHRRHEPAGRAQAAVLIGQITASPMAARRSSELIQLLAKLPGLGPRSARRAALHLLKQRETLMPPPGGDARHGRARGAPVPGLRQSRCRRSVLDLRRSRARRRPDLRRRGGRRPVGAGALRPVSRAATTCSAARSRRSTAAARGSRHRPAAGRVARRPGRPRSSSRPAPRSTARPPRTTSPSAWRPTGPTVTRLAHGVPIGGELNYLDDGTLGAALEARRPIRDRAADPA